eukprot:TRINITY_DN57365_c0_g1_i1.p1 TRINITY_DN57365_c0_g1~~TRINITY_DN57365_c0_g1_i1.p1  ORF type:complete len:331 (+),score=20.13 TRINITY_DN57365_c0_g1_i1:69-1061(+)
MTTAMVCTPQLPRVSRANWLLFNETAPHDRTRSLPRLARRTVSSSLQYPARLAGVRHPDERTQRRKLLLDPDNPVPVITRPRAGGCWAAVGRALRVHGDRPAERGCPAVINSSHECLEFKSAFPEFSAVGARTLQPKAINRVAFELSIDPKVNRHILQVGVVRVADNHISYRYGQLDELTPALACVACSNVGEVVSTSGPLEIVAPGENWPGLRQRLPDWCSGAPQWLAGGLVSAVVLLEIDLRMGRLAISVDKWSEDPAVLSVPGLLDENADMAARVQGSESTRAPTTAPSPTARAVPAVELPPWRPFVSLTAVGQQARIIDLHARMDV